MDLSDLARSIHVRLDAKNAAREQALPAARRSIRASANAIRAIHRLEFDTAKTLIGESRASLDEGLAAVRDHADIRHAGYLQDAQKEYAEANLTMALVTGGDLPDPTDLDVEDAAYLGGMSDAIGEGRRRLLDLLREGRVAQAEELLDAMEEMFGVLVAMDYPDAITMNLRRATDVSRSLIEKTRGDLSISVVQKDLRDALDRHAAELHPRAQPDV
ncbi:MAG TPA: haloacid dehalogenase [Actinomycetota bacterium]|nr:haloacid dehalogenase [Actinomycetota bacterium]